MLPEVPRMKLLLAYRIINWIMESFKSRVIVYFHLPDIFFHNDSMTFNN